jgi:hypothetical protein
MHDDRFLFEAIAGALFWLYVIYKIASFSLYKARLFDGAISVRPFGTFKWKSLPVSSIDRVQVERLRPNFSGTDKQLPTSRLEFQGQGHELVAISLKHFRQDDLRRLLSAMKAARPDLNLPTV